MEFDLSRFLWAVIPAGIMWMVGFGCGVDDTQRQEKLIKRLQGDLEEAKRVKGKCPYCGGS